MDTVKILHCADVHIGVADSSLGKLAAARRYETLLTFEKIIDAAKNNGVQIIAIAGDLFDSNHIGPSLTKPVFEKIASVPQIKVIFAAGNHDPLDSDSPFIREPRPDNLFVFGTEDECITFDSLKLRVYGRSFGSVHMRGETHFSIIPPDDGYINLMVLHGDLRNDMNSDYNAVTPAFIKSCKMDYIALGHVHKRTEIGCCGSTYMAYCGCPEGQGFDELDEKGVYIGNIGKGICDLEFLPISKRRHISEKIDITGLSETQEISDKILSTLKEKYGEETVNNLYKIELIGKIAENAVISTEQLTSRLSEKLYYVKIKDKTEFDIDLKLLSLEKNLKGIFVKNMLRMLDDTEPQNRESIEYALNLGLKAFNSEVPYDED